MLPIRIAAARIGPALLAVDADERLLSIPSRPAPSGTGLVFRFTHRAVPRRAVAAAP